MYGAVTDLVRASKKMMCQVESIDYDQRRMVVTVVIHELHEPDKTGTVEFVSNEYPEALAVHVISGDRSNIVYFKHENGWGAVNTKAIPRPAG